jgi:hypothetical protein
MPEPLRIGRWSIAAIPPGWSLLPDYGLRRAREGAFPAHIGVAEDTLLAGNQLGLYLQAQITLLQRTFSEPAIAGPLPPGSIPEGMRHADESMLLMIRHRGLYGPAVFQVQHYVRAGQWIGIVTLTAPEPEFLPARSGFDALLSSLSISPEPAVPSS